MAIQKFEDKYHTIILHFCWVNKNTLYCPEITTFFILKWFSSPENKKLQKTLVVFYLHFPLFFCRWYCPPGKMASNWQLSRTTLRPILSENFVQGQRGRRSCWQLRPPSWWAQHLSLPKAKRGVATAGVAQFQDKPCRMSFAERVMFRAGKETFSTLTTYFFQTWRNAVQFNG